MLRRRCNRGSVEFWSTTLWEVRDSLCLEDLACGSTSNFKLYSGRFSGAVNRPGDNWTALVSSGVFRRVGLPKGDVSGLMTARLGALRKIRPKYTVQRFSRDNYDQSSIDFRHFSTTAESQVQKNLRSNIQDSCRLVPLMSVLLLLGFITH